jgi:hypothetical protein
MCEVAFELEERDGGCPAEWSRFGLHFISLRLLTLQSLQSLQSKMQ